MATDTDIEQFSGPVQFADSHVLVADGRREVSSSMDFGGLVGDALGLAAFIHRASAGLDETTVRFEVICDIGCDYGVIEPVDVAEAREVTVVVTGWRDLDLDERATVADLIDDRARRGGMPTHPDLARPARLGRRLR